MVGEYMSDSFFEDDRDTTQEETIVDEFFDFL